MQPSRKCCVPAQNIVCFSFFSTICSIFAIVLGVATVYDAIVIQWLEKGTKEPTKCEVCCNKILSLIVFFLIYTVYNILCKCSEVFR